MYSTLGRRERKPRPKETYNVAHRPHNNNTQEAAIALLPSTTHPQSWAKPHIHVHTGKSLPSVPPSPKALLYILPSTKCTENLMLQLFPEQQGKIYVNQPPFSQNTQLIV